MHMKRLAGAILVAGGALLILAGADALAQSKGGAASDASKEWPTYGHDPGGMRFSPLTQITAANVSQLKVAWVYHMKPAGAVIPAGRGAVDPEGEPAGAPGGPGARGGRRGGGSGFLPSETTPLVIDG